MSKWTDFRDRVIESIHVEEVTEDVKEDFTRWLLDILLPAVKPTADDFVAQLREQAKDESGWCKVRDMAVLPFVIEGGLWLIEKALTKSLEK